MTIWSNILAVQEATVDYRMILVRQAVSINCPQLVSFRSKPTMNSLMWGCVKWRTLGAKAGSARRMQPRALLVAQNPSGGGAYEVRDKDKLAHERGPPRVSRVLGSPWRLSTSGGW